MNEKEKSASTPFASHYRLNDTLSPRTKVEKEYMSKVPYANVIGILMYAMVCTRLDILYVIGVLSGYMYNRGKEHWQAMKWIQWYIRNTVDVSLVFEQGDSQYLDGYCDLDYVGDLEKLRSTIGYVFTIANTPVS